MSKFVFLPIKNIYYLIKKNTMMIGIMLISQIVSVLVILLAYGMIMNSKKEANEAGKYERILMVSLPKELNLPYKDARQVFDELFREFDGRIEAAGANAYDKENNTDIWCHFNYKNGNIIPDEEWKLEVTALQSHCKGRLYSDEEFYSGEKVVVTNDGWGDVETCMIAGEEYKVVGHFFEGGYAGPHKVLEMPYLSLNDNITITGVNIFLNTLPTVSEYNEFATRMFEAFHYQCDVQMPDKFANDTKNMYKTYMIVAIIMLIMSAINIGIVYGYILTIRRRNNAVMSLCGGRGFSIAVIHLIEMSIICICAYIVAVLLFNSFILYGLKDIFVYFTDIYDREIFVDIFGIYFISIMIAGIYNVVRVLQKQTVDALRGGMNE